MTTRERAHRAARIVAARHSGVTWSRIAAEFDLSVRQAQNIVADWQDSEPDDVDGIDALQGLIHLLRQAIEDLAVTAQRASHDSNRIGAIKALVETAMLRWQVERAAGLVPRHPAAPSLHQEMQVVFQEFAELLRRHNVADEALREFLELAERVAQQPRQPSPTGRLALTTGGTT